ncbi:MAG: outer membrane beta-barrel protein [Bacteroidales bacterium]|nr:outer membrane beta-barrel protein [Bacteroidales bacterium]
MKQEEQYFDNHKDFDEHIRNLLSHAEETPPADAWEGISSRLPKGIVVSENQWRNRRRKIAAAVGAVAAVLLAVLLISWPSQPQDAETLVAKHAQSVENKQIDRDPAANESEHAVETTANEPEHANAVEPTAERIAHAAEPTPATTAVDRPTHASATESTAHANTSTGTGTSIIAASTSSEQNEDNPEEISVLQQPETDLLLADNGTSPKRKKSGINLSAFSNALSNFTGDGNHGNNPYRNQGYYQLTHSISEISEVNYSIPFSVGLNVSYDLNERWAVGIGLNYTRLSRNYAGTYYTYENGIVKESTYYDKIYNIQQFIGIPITAYFSILKNNHIHFYAHGGVVLEKCLGNTWTAQNRQLNYTESVEGVQFSAGAGIGVNFLITPMFSIYLEPDVKYYFPWNQPTSIRTRQPFMLGFEIGGRFHL